MPARAASDVTSADVLLVGGGLSASLIALRLKRGRPNLKIVMLERQTRIGGEHTWCHFAADVSPGHRRVAGPADRPRVAGVRGEVSGPSARADHALPRDHL